jgi:hypothetical protein
VDHIAHSIDCSVPDARVSVPIVAYTPKSAQRAVGVGRGALAAELVEAVPVAMPFVPDLLGEAACVEVRPARAVLVDRLAVGEERAALVVEGKVPEARTAGGLRKMAVRALERDHRLALEDLGAPFAVGWAGRRMPPEAQEPIAMAPAFSATSLTIESAVLPPIMQ